LTPIPRSLCRESTVLNDRRFVLSLAPNTPDTLSRLVGLAEEAGTIALACFQLGGKTKAGIEWKGDGSPVTEADYAVNAFLEPRLKALWPEAAWLSEESPDDTRRLAASQVIIVDPIDGTRGFSRGDPHWCVSIALADAGRPICGVVHAPALRETYAAQTGRGATLNGVPLRVGSAATLNPSMRITCPNVLAKTLRDIGEEFDFQPKIASLALRIAKVASGVYEAGLTTSSSHDWDLAAADLVLQEAGGILASRGGRPLVYNKPDPTHGVLAASSLALGPALSALLERTDLGQPAG
jgi:myo-inositol-1(or 4)-monophosphatase